MSTETPTGDGTPTSTATPYDISVPSKGGSDMSVYVFTDFAMPEARDFWLEEEPDLAGYIEDNRMALGFFHLPAPVNRWSREIPSACFEVQAQLDTDAFWRFVRGIFENFENYSYDVIRSVANDVGADGDRVVLAAQQRRGQEQLQLDVEFAHRHGVQEPFKVVVNNQLGGDATLAADITAENIKSVVDELE